jgi:lysozyme family protein
MTFAACMPVIFASEGGYVCDPADPGGATNLGVTIAVLSAHRGHPCTPDDVRALQMPEAAEIYQGDYYNPAHCPDLPPGIDLVVFDAAVNNGVGRAIKLLQAAVGVASDGHFGPATLAAVKASSPREAINRFHDLHADFYAGLPTFWKFGKGWDARNDRTRSIALGMV